MLKYETQHDYYMDAMNVGYIESMGCLFVQDSDENTININGVDADNFIRCIRNSTCANDKVWDHIKNTQHSNDYLKEIHKSIGEYLLQNKLIEDIEEKIEAAKAAQGV